MSDHLNTREARRVPGLMTDLHRLFTTQLYRRLKAEGIALSRSQWRALTHLVMQAGLSQSELAERLLMEKAPVGSLLDKLEDAGLIERRADPKDRRVRRVFITPKAAPLLPLIEQQVETLEQAALAGITEQEQALLADLLGRMYDNMLDQRQREA